MAASLPDFRIITLALLYSVGAHGIMTLNDFKSIDGDKRLAFVRCRCSSASIARFGLPAL